MSVCSGIKLFYSVQSVFSHDVLYIVSVIEYSDHVCISVKHFEFIIAVCLISNTTL